MPKAFKHTETLLRAAWLLGPLPRQGSTLADLHSAHLGFLGDRMVQLMCLAEQEADALRTAATQQVARQRELANVAFAAQQAEQARALQDCHEAAEREMRLVHSLH